MNRGGDIVERSSKLIPNDLIAQCKSAITLLAKDNDGLTNLSQFIDDFVNDTSIKSEAFDTLKNQMYNFGTAISIMMMANDADIESYNRLIGMVGTEDLDGEILFDQLEEAERSTKDAEEKIEYYKSVLSGTISTDSVNSYMLTSIEDYNKLIEANNEIIRKINEKIDLFDSIQSESMGMFGQGEYLRLSAMSVIEEIGKSYISNGDYITTDNRELYDSTTKELASLGIIIGAANDIYGEPIGNDETVEYGVEWSKTTLKKQADFKEHKVYYDYKSRYRYSALYNDATYEEGILTTKAQHSIGKADLDAQGKFVLWNEKTELDPQLSLKGDAEMSAYEARADITIGNEDIFSKTRLEGDVGMLNAEGKLQFSTGKDGNGVKVGAGFDLEASMFGGEVTQKFNIFGYELQLSAEGNILGLGAEAEASYDAGVCTFKLGATPGIGGSIGVKFGKNIPEDDPFLTAGP